MTRPTEMPETILVYVGLDFIGDGLMKLPFVRALRNAFPESRITWLAGKGKTVYAGKLRPLVEGLIDEVIEEAAIGSRWAEIFRRPLPRRRFDLVLDTQRRLVTTMALRRVRHRRFVSGCAGYLFSDVRPPGALSPGYRKQAALIDQMLELVALARTGHADAPLDCSGAITLPAAVTAEAARLLPEGGRCVAMAPGAGERSRCWPLDRFMALGRWISAQRLVPVYVLGPEETGWLAPLREAVPEARFPLAEPEAALEMEPLLSIALAARCLACVANDSGGGHLFAASGTPLISLYGPTTPGKFAPRIARLTILDARSYGSRETSAIPLEAVESAVTAIRGRAPPARDHACSGLRPD